MTDNNEEYEAMEAAQKLTAGNASWLNEVLSNLEPSVAHWNHRVVKRTDRASGETWYGIHECYYDPVGWTEEPIAVVGESLDDLKWTLEKMMLALDSPVIEDKD